MVFYSWKEMDDVCARGFRDAYNFIKREGIKTCMHMAVNQLHYYGKYHMQYVKPPNKGHFGTYAVLSFVERLSSSS